MLRGCRHVLLALVAAGMCAREVRGSDASTSTGSAVVELTPAELHKLEQGTWLLEFYAPWCGYCKQLEPIFEDVAAGLAGRGVEVARIDASKYKSAALRFGVQGFPTIMHVHDGDVRTYQGPRTEASMIEFATASWKSASIDLNSPLGGSPFSTGAKAVGVMVDNILTLQDGYDWVREKTNLSHPVLLALLAVLAIVVGSVWGLLLSLFFPVRRSTATASHKQD